MENKQDYSKASFAGVLVTLGIVFGDIGTSPLYVLNAVIGAHKITEQLVLGGLSCVFWTLTFQTTLKYVLITLRADNKGEGGILSLYALVRRKSNWLVFPAIIGASTLLADGIITPPISVSSAIEGLTNLNFGFDIEPFIIPIVITIILGLFIFQQFGTQIVGRFFGPVMILWFTTLAALGISNFHHYPTIFKAFSPTYAYDFLVNFPGGFWLLGGVFLCTTGAEALYSDLGHCGRKNIQLSWMLVKICLLINYFGQGAWLLGTLANSDTPYLAGKATFYSSMPEWFLIPGIIIATMAAIIASQALISGSYTLISEAIRLNLWPKVRIIYPTIQKGQVYIPSINWLLCAGCIGIVLYFKKSSAMEGAYGLAITLTMMVTTILLSYYLKVKKVNPIIIALSLIFFLSIELAFLIANLEKLPHGGFVTVLVSFVLIVAMWIWFSARRIKNRFTEFDKLDKHLPLIKELSLDTSIPKYATNLVYLTSADYPNEIEKKIIYSLFNKQPKRADTYWFVHVDVLDDPHTKEYKVTQLVDGIIYKIEFKLGFRVAPQVNLFFRKVIEEMTKNGEVDVLSRYNSLRTNNIIGDFRFVVIERILNYDLKLPAIEQFIMSGYALLKELSLSEEKGFGLDTSMVTLEKVPMITVPPKNIVLNRLED